MIAVEGSVIGIDVGCSPKRRSSAICRLDWTPSVVVWEIARFRALEPEREDTIAALSTARSISTAALDGPLRRGFDEIGRYRAAERMLTRGLQSLIGKPGQSSAPVGKALNRHANVCAGHLLACADLQNATHAVPIDRTSIVEAFPSSFLGMMIENPGQLATRRGDRSDVYFQHLAINGTLTAIVERCLPGRMLLTDPRTVTNHDDRAALVCALTALAVAAGDFVAVGDDDGWIVLPPRRFIQPEQWSILEVNAAGAGSGVLHVETAERVDGLPQ